MSPKTMKMLDSPDKRVWPTQNVRAVQAKLKEISRLGLINIQKNNRDLIRQ